MDRIRADSSVIYSSVISWIGISCTCSHLVVLAGGVDGSRLLGGRDGGGGERGHRAEMTNLVVALSELVVVHVPPG